MLWAMSARRLALTPSKPGASGCALTRARAAATAARVEASSGKETSSGSAGLPWARPVLDSEGGSRINTSPSVASPARADVGVLACLTAMSMPGINLDREGQAQSDSGPAPPDHREDPGRPRDRVPQACGRPRHRLIARRRRHDLPAWSTSDPQREQTGPALTPALPPPRLCDCGPVLRPRPRDRLLDRADGPAQSALPVSPTPSFEDRWPLVGDDEPRRSLHLGRRAHRTGPQHRTTRLPRARSLTHGDGC